MKTKSILSLLLGVVAAFLLVTGLGFAFLNRNAQPKLGEIPPQSARTAENFMEALCRGDFRTAGMLCYGQPHFEVSAPSGDAMAARVQQAFQEQIAYTFTTDFYLKDGTLHRDVQLQNMDLQTLVEKIGQVAYGGLRERVQLAEETEELYDENGDFRQELLGTVMQEAVTAALQMPTMQTLDTTLELRQVEGQWWVIPQKELLTAAAGNLGA